MNQQLFNVVVECQALHWRFDVNDNLVKVRISKNIVMQFEVPERTDLSVSVMLLVGTERCVLHDPMPLKNVIPYISSFRQWYAGEVR